MARSSKSFAELRRESIGAELARREADSRKAAISEWQRVLEDDAAAPRASKVRPADR